MKFMLKIMLKDGVHEEYLLKKPVTYIGRMEENDVVINDDHVSKRHAKLVISKKFLELHDLGSTNGTKVNGVFVGHKFLRHNDQIKIGNREIITQIETDKNEEDIDWLDKTICSSGVGEPIIIDFNAINSDLKFHFDMIKSCSIKRKDGRVVLLATRPDSRYPFFYPRDGACAARLFRKYAISDLSCRKEAYQLLEQMAYFLKETQRIDGYWGQRYSVAGEDEAIYKQEDNIAHAIATICNYLLTAHELGEKIVDLEGFLDSINRGCNYALKNYYRNEIHLFFSTTSIHESALEQGFTCWVNFAYLYSLTLVFRVCEEMDLHRLISNEALDILCPFKNNLFELMSENGRFIRRISADGRPDYRPDVTLISPFYFGFISKEIEAIVENSMNIVEKQLWDPELGLLQRYLPFAEDPDVHIHAGNGAWLHFSATLAQYYYYKKETEKGDMTLSLINRFKNKEGGLPEHISTLKRFREFLKNEWDTGLDFEKEFDQSILLDDIKFDKILKEAQKMYSSYIEVENSTLHKDKNMMGGGYIRFCTPLMWSHVEYSKALLARSRQTFYAREHTEIIKLPETN